MAKDDLNEVCNVLITARDTKTGKIIAERVGHNVWTNTGREYSCLLKTYKNNNRETYRNDKICYIGLGTGTQVESVAVRRLSQPVAWSAGKFLKEINHGLTSFQSPLGVRTAVRYTVRYSEEDLSNNDISFITECGLFTDGREGDFIVGQRNVNINEAGLQSPVAYHTFDPIPKSSSVQLDIVWELRH